MKKQFLLCFFILVCLSLFAQNQDLYDVNYDMPKIKPSFENADYEFQKIYIQYEDALKTQAESIRKEEKEFYQAEVEKIRQEEHQFTKESIEQARQEIYNSEIQSVRNKETERLTQEIIEKLTKELTAKISLEYENKKNQELAELEKRLRKEIYEETKTTTARIKYISFSISLVIIFILIVMIIVFIFKKIKGNAKNRADNKKQIDLRTLKYIEKLKTLKGECSSILAEINQLEGAEKDIAQKALELAKLQYEKGENLKNCKKDFSDLSEKFKNTYKFCVQNKDDSDFIKSQVKEFEVNVNNFKKLASTVFSPESGITEEDKKDFISHHFDLENFATQIDGIIVDDKELKADLRNVVKEYKSCAKIFERGKIQ